MDFYTKRVKRIFPALILVLFTSFIIGWFTLLADEYKQLGKHIAAAAIFTSNFVLFNEVSYFDNAGNTKPLLHLWSLGIEEQFYIIWPLLLWILWKRRLNSIYIIVLVAVISFTFNMQYVYTHRMAAFYLPQARFWELICGSFVAWLSLGNFNKAAIYPAHFFQRNKIINDLFSIVGTLFIAYGLFTLTKNNHFPGTMALIPTIGAVLIIYAGSEAWINRIFLSNRILVWFGLISFPLYLWHWPLLVFSKLSIADSIIDARISKALVVLLSIFLAWLTYELIEKPIRFGKNSSLKVILLVGLSSIVSGVGYGIYINNGLDFRIPKILRYVNESDKYSPKYLIGSCFLEKDSDQFGDCMLSKDNNKKKILLWGDSHAAHFYAGYKEKYGKKFNIVLRSAAGCRPILKEPITHTKCDEINRNIFELVKKEKPEKIILSAAWSHHNDWRDISKTINQLRAAGVVNIDLIGPAPDWINTLPRQLLIYSKIDKQHRIPVRMSFGLSRDFLKVDQLMKELATHEKINYISLAKILCNQEGCITRLGNHLDYLITLDYGHFTEAGSLYVVSKFPEIL